MVRSGARSKGEQPAKSEPKQPPRPSIMVFSIEDRVDFLFDDGEDTWESLQPFSSNRFGLNYFAVVRGLMKDALEALAKQNKYSGRFASMISAVQAIVVSTPGVVENNETLLQLPLWNWPDTPVYPNISWDWNGEHRQYFNFSSEICDIIEEICLKHNYSLDDYQRSAIYRHVFVINDATAAAAFEYFKRRQHNDVEDFIYVKAHNGINAGVIEKEGFYNAGDVKPSFRLRIRTTHPEAGHFFPIVHELDLDSNFQGVCPFHSACLEGMVASHSFYARTQMEDPGPFLKWAAFVESLERISEHGEEVEEHLLNYLIGSDTRQSRSQDGIDLIAFYIAQLVHRLAIGTLTPEKIIIGGRMARRGVIEAVRHKVQSWTSGYPQRDQLQTKLGQYIVEWSAEEQERPFVEVLGAFVLAQARAGVPIEQLALPSKSQSLEPRESAEGSDQAVIYIKDRLASRLQDLKKRGPSKEGSE